MHAHTIIGLGLAVAATTLTNVAYTREQVAASGLPPLSLRRPFQSLGFLLKSRGWLLGFAMESGGFACYAAALALASLALVQSIGAGGLGVLAYVSARVTGRRLGRRQVTGVGLSLLGLFALGLSLAKSVGEGSSGSIADILAWLGASVALAVAVLWVGRRRPTSGIAEGVAGGLFFSVGDVSTKLATQGGARFAFVITLIVGYSLGTSLLQVGYQRGTALTVAGLATLCTNALPIAAGTIVLKEAVPSGALGAVRVIAYVAVTAGAILLATPDRRAADAVPGRTREATASAPAGQPAPD